MVLRTKEDIEVEVRNGRSIDQNEDIDTDRMRDHLEEDRGPEVVKERSIVDHVQDHPIAHEDMDETEQTTPGRLYKSY